MTEPMRLNELAELAAKAFTAKAALVDGSGDELTGDNGQFTAIVSVFDTIDDEGDMIVRGAFADEIAELRAKAAAKNSDVLLPIYWNHDHNNTANEVGEVLELEELAGDDPRLEGFPHLVGKGGLWVRGRLDAAKQSARDIWRGMRAGRVKEFSFYATKGNASEVRIGDRMVRVIDRIAGLVEVGPTPRGMNTATALLTLKSYGLNEVVPMGTPDGPPPAPTPADDGGFGDRARLLAFLQLN